MRRMYSEQELTNTIKAVFEQELEDGALDDKVVDAVDAYLVEHPVDPTAITGLDIAPKDVTASGNITAPSIIETNTGYSAELKNPAYLTVADEYISVVKNGNKVTFVFFAKLTRTDTASSPTNLVRFTIPSAVGSKLYPFSFGGYISALDAREIKVLASASNIQSLTAFFIKQTNTAVDLMLERVGDLTLNTAYLCRIEITFLLSDNLISE